MSIAEQLPIVEGTDNSLPLDEEQYIQRTKRIPLLNGREEEKELAQQIEAGLFAQQILDNEHDDEGTPLIPAEVREKYDPVELEAIAAEGRQAKQRFLEGNLRLVLKPAKTVSEKMKAPYIDCVQMGNLGLIRAVEKFDYKKGFKFSTYAMWWIKQALQREINNTHRQVRLTAEIEINVSSAFRARNRLIEKLGRDPTDAEVAVEMDLSEEKVTELFSIAREPLSYDATTKKDEPESGLLQEVIVDADEPDVQAIDNMLQQLDAESRLAAQFLAQMLSDHVISQLQYDTLIEDFCIDGEPTKNAKELAAQLGAKHATVASRRRKGLNAIKAYMLEVYGQQKIEELRRSGEGNTLLA